MEFSLDEETLVKMILSGMEANDEPHIGYSDTLDYLLSLFLDNDEKLKSAFIKTIVAGYDNSCIYPLHYKDNKLKICFLNDDLGDDAKLEGDMDDMINYLVENTYSCRHELDDVKQLREKFMNYVELCDEEIIRIEERVFT